MDILQKIKNSILIISEQPEISNLTEKFLKLGDFEVIKSTNVKEALKVLEEHYKEIAVVMLDIMLPGRSGYNALESIKNNDKYKDVIVVLLTNKGTKLSGNGNDEDFSYPYIFKPPSPPGDLGLVGELLSKPPITEEIQENELYCKHCGSKLAKGQSICPNCGNKVI